jgi:hypothetical protein
MKLGELGEVVEDVRQVIFKEAKVILAAQKRPAFLIDEGGIEVMIANNDSTEKVLCRHERCPYGAGLVRHCMIQPLAVFLFFLWALM